MSSALQSDDSSLDVLIVEMIDRGIECLLYEDDDTLCNGKPLRVGVTKHYRFIIDNGLIKVGPNKRSVVTIWENKDRSGQPTVIDGPFISPAQQPLHTIELGDPDSITKLEMVLNIPPS